jgi:hypothetical protein
MVTPLKSAKSEPAVTKTWLVLDPSGNKVTECGSLESAQIRARFEAKAYPEMVVTIFEAVEMYRAPLAETEKVSL